TMGGLSFIAAALIVFIPFAVYLVSKGGDGVDRMAIVMLMATANGAVGIVHDLTNFKYHPTEGLTASQKYLLQLICAGLFLAAMKLTGNLSETLYIPYVGVELDLGIFYYILSILLITGIINSVNLTDGIDGLASTVTLAVAAF